MGTRQEIGLVMLILLLALPAWLGNLGAEPPDVPTLDCQQALVLAGDLSRPGLVCASSQIPLGCEPDTAWPPGSRVVLKRGPEDACRATVGPMTGAERLLVGLGIDPNSANEEDLQLMPGIGPALSKRIAEHRAAHGCFDEIETLIQVRGIGPKTLERIRPFVQLGKCPLARPASR